MSYATPAAVVSLREFSRMAEELRRNPAFDPRWCDDCGMRHTTIRRRKILARMGADTTVEDVRAAFGSHLWPAGAAGDRMIARDLEILWRNHGR